MASRFRSIPLIGSLEDTIDELVEPLENVQLQIHEEQGGNMPDSLDLLIGELTMVALIFMNVDLNVSEEETAILNDFRQAMYAKKFLDLTSHDYRELCRKFLRIHPDRRLSIDHTPYSIQYLQIYDQQHETGYAEKAKAMFFRLASAIVKSDGTETSEEMMTLSNFKEILYSSNPITAPSEGKPANIQTTDVSE